MREISFKKLEKCRKKHCYQGKTLLEEKKEGEINEEQNNKICDKWKRHYRY